MKPAKKLILSLSFCLLTQTEQSFAQPTQAVTIVPVADLILEKMKTVYPEKKVAHSYESISLESKTLKARSCARAHQLIFNEQVTVICQEGDEALVEVPNCFYLSSGKKRNRYWTHKTNLQTLSKKLDPKKTPTPIQFCTKKTEQKSQTIITLLLPFYDKKNKRIFSAGTRFVQAPGHSNQKLSVWALNKRATAYDLLNIPKAICFKEKPLSKEKKRNLFVQLLKTWAHRQPKQFIPYVWGGCSFTRPYERKMIYAAKNQENEKIIWQKKELKIATGLDCSGTILRATQIFNIPYFCKNSISAKQHLKKVKNYNELKNGDLLYIRGHIMIVSDKKKNKLIEARSHYSGYGKLQEKNISQIFKGTKTYQQLIALCNANKPLARIDSVGKIDKVAVGTFLKLPV